MLGPESPETVRAAAAAAVECFRDRIDGELARLCAGIDAEILEMLAGKMAVLMLADLVNDTPEVPYISVWHSGRAEIRQIYIGPRVIDLLGYSCEEIGRIGFANLAGDRIVNCFEERDGLACRTVTKKRVARERRDEFLGNRVWKGFYRLKTKGGGTVWVMDTAVLTKFVNESGGDVVYVSEGILVEAGEIMEKIRAAR